MACSSYICFLEPMGSAALDCDCSQYSGNNSSDDLQDLLNG
jgi:hypothetical protein